MEFLIEKAKKYVRNLLEGEGSGHDWWHIYRVYQMAMNIASSTEGANKNVVALAALLHDVGDHKFHNGDATVGPKMVTEWLQQNGANKEVIQAVVTVVKEISFKGAEVDTPMSSLEGQIVQDADRLDAIGAVGIGRTFAFGGNKNREMHNPNIPPKQHASFDEYKKDKGPTINHFYEKLLLLKDRMNTSKGRELAQERHAFMLQFLDQFFAEWEGSR